MTYPLVSIIIPNYNGKRFLEACLSSVLRQRYPKNKMEVILVDDASTDDSVDFIKRKFPSVKILALKKNVGYIGANNQAYKKTRGKYVLLLNNDTVVSKNWLMPLVQTLESNPDVVGVTSMAFRMRAKKLDDKYGIKWNLSPICNGISDPNKDNVYTLFPESGSCLIRKDAFKQPFDPDYIVYQEDVWTGWKAWLQGYKIMFNKKSKYRHWGSLSYGCFNYRHVYFNERNKFLNVLSFLKFETILFLSPILLIDFISRIGYFLSSKKIDLVKAEFSAILWNIRNVKLLLKKRRAIQRLRKVNDYVILNIFSEVTYVEKHFIKKLLNGIFKAYFNTVRRVCKTLEI